MALDGMYLSFLVSKVNELLTGAKVDKIHQPSKNELVFIMRTRGGMHKLYFSADANSPRFAVTESVPENPQTPPMLCMLSENGLWAQHFWAWNSSVLTELHFLILTQQMR